MEERNLCAPPKDKARAHNKNNCKRAEKGRTHIHMYINICIKICILQNNRQSKQKASKNNAISDSK